MAEWETFDPPGFSVWCDKTVVLGGLLALSGRMISASTLLDAISLIDAIVWFDHIVVDSTLELTWPNLGVAWPTLSPFRKAQVIDAITSSDQRDSMGGARELLTGPNLDLGVAWPTQIDDMITRRTLSSEELSQLRKALIATWNQSGVDSTCQTYWRQLFRDRKFSLNLSEADFAVDSARDPAQFLESADAADWRDAKVSAVAKDWRPELAAFSTARALSGNLIAAQLGLFHMPSAMRRGLLASFNAPCQVTDVIAIEPVHDARLPSAFGRITEVAIERGCALWDAVATVRHELAPVRQSLRGSLTDPSRIRMTGVRDRLGFGKPEAQVGFGLNFAMLSGFYGRSVRSRQVEIVQKLAQAAENLVEAADDLCRLARLDVPVINPALTELTEIAQRLAA